MSPFPILELGASDPSDILRSHYRATVTPSPINLDTTTKQYAVVFRATEAIQITRVALRFADWCYNVAPTYRIGLQGVDASGNPDGTWKAAGAAYVDFTPTGTGNDNTLVWFTLGAPHTPAAGELLALVMLYQAGTVNASNCTSLTRYYFCQTYVSSFPYLDFYTAAWAKEQNGAPPFAYGNATRVFGAPYQNLLTTVFNANSNPDEYALRFTIPSTLGARFTVRGARILGAVPPAGKTFDLILYDTDHTTILHTTTIDSDTLSNPGYPDASLFYFTDATLTPLLPDTVYSLSLKPNQNDTGISWLALESPAAECLDAWPLGATWHKATRVDGGAWTAHPAVRPIASLLIEALTLTYPPPDADAIPAFPVVMLSASDAKTPLEGLTVTAETMIDGADFTACTNAVTEKSDGVYLLDIAGADQGDVTTLLKFSAPGALTQYATLVR